MSKDLNVAKTIKLFIKGEFPRTESGRSYPVSVYNKGQVYAHVCQASRKDMRNAVEAAQGALGTWSKKTAYNRSQILYRMAEMLEGKRAEFSNLLNIVLGRSEAEAKKELDEAIEAFLYYAGFADKFSQIMASVNPVSGPFHNFSTPEPVGVVGLLYDKDFHMATFVSQIAAVICSGNVAVVVFDQPGAVMLSELGEVFKTSDLPAGVINLLSGHVDELYKHLSQHMEVHSLLYFGDDEKRLNEIKEASVENMKRVVPWTFENLGLQPISAFTEIKTIWHPVGM